MSDHDPELLSASLDGALTGEEAARVDTWLAESPAARAERDGLASVKAAVGALPPVEPPAGFYEAMLARGAPRADDEAVVVPLRRRRRPILAAGAAAIAVAAAAVVVAGTSTVAVTPPVDDVEAALVAPDDDLDVDVVSLRGDDGRFAVLGQDADEVRWDRLPTGDRGREDGVETWVDLTSDPGTARVVVAQDGRVYTLVSDDIDAEELLEVGADLPGDDSLLGRFRRACQDLLGGFSGD